MISYEPLWQTMKNRNISTYVLIKDHNINPRTINNLKHNKSVTTATIEQLCKILDCTSNDILLVTPE